MIGSLGSNKHSGGSQSSSSNFHTDGVNQQNRVRSRSLSPLSFRSDAPVLQGVVPARRSERLGDRQEPSCEVLDFTNEEEG